MKKYLAIFCALILMTSFVSCGDSQKSSSEPSGSVSESITEEPTTEEPTEPETEEPTTEPETEPPTEEEITLDSEWESDYLTIAKSSEWEETVETEDDKIVVFWEWQDRKIGLYIYQPPKNETFGDYETDRFTKNGQEYIVLKNKEIHFINPVISGTICPSDTDKEIIMGMIDSIEFKGNTATAETTEEEVTTTKATEPPTEKPTEPPTNPPIIVQEESQTVYYTETGSKYHYDSKCGRGDYFPCTLDEALEMGLEPCKKCTEAN